VNEKGEEFKLTFSWNDNDVFGGSFSTQKLFSNNFPLSQLKLLFFEFEGL